MGDFFSQWIGQLVGWVWNYPVVGLCVLGGVFFTLRFSFIQFRAFPHAFDLIRGVYDNPKEKGQITHFQALCAALSGTIGLGNIAGVAIAIGLGGPGAILWMWLVGFLAMATKFVECTLGTAYRDELENGQVRGGPMYYMSKGLGRRWKPVALFFSITLSLAALGAGNMFQANQAASALQHYYDVPVAVTGIILMVLTGLVIIGGIKRIGSVASKIIPVMCVGYVVGAVLICLMNIDKVPYVINVILSDAFTGRAAAGGSIVAVILMGVRRAVFSNEAGLGTAPIAHAAVKTNYPIREGFVASLGPFIDTILVCTATAMVIIMSGFYGSEMYQSQGHTVGFQPQAQHVTLSGNWGVTDRDVPLNQDPILRLREGQSAAHFNSTVSTFEPLSVVVSTQESDGGGLYDGVRFSYYRKAGDMMVQLVSSTNDVLGAVVLKEGVHAVTATDVNDSVLFTVKNGGDVDKWSSSVVLFGSSLKDQLNGEPVSLRLIPAAGAVNWYVDRVHGVTELAGIKLTTVAFDTFFKGFGSIFITFAVFFFAFSTLITWSYYGEVSASYALGKWVVKPYKWLFVGVVFFGAVKELAIVLNFADLMIGFLVVPNMIAIVMLSPKVFKWLKEYRKALYANEFERYSATPSWFSFKLFKKRIRQSG